MSKDALNAFGDLIIGARDQTLENLLRDLDVRGSNHTGFGSLLRNRRVTDALLAEVIDHLLFNLMVAIQETDISQEVRLKIARDGTVHDVLEITDGLAGELLTDQGWIAQKSKFSDRKIEERTRERFAPPTAPAAGDGTQYYTLTSNPAQNTQSFIYQTDAEAARLADENDDIYLGPYTADDLGRDEITFHDWIPSVSSFVMTDRFVSTVQSYDMRQPDFFEVQLTWGPENLLEWVGDEIKAFFTMRPPAVDVIDPEKTPLHFWPQLKKYKLLDYVVTQPLPEGVHLAVDRSRPFMAICTDRFKTWAERDGLRLGFEPVPCAISTSSAPKTV
ncbi:hypothetical protein [Thalassococcus sp. S3]|uniref:hypothetical protein n=1 Tax=Thalassococcus sp. S3 TaxID=2017482 RepID=UPI0010246666|nr:hypothetical protein [Thalassococcus sp. S3]QBF31925.1 hypothetical protein CFI11_11935 [Thalassococcus sp. S3]